MKKLQLLPILMCLMLVVFTSCENDIEDSSIETEAALENSEAPTIETKANNVVRSRIQYINSSGGTSKRQFTCSNRVNGVNTSGTGSKRVRNARKYWNERSRAKRKGKYLCNFLKSISTNTCYCS